MPSPEENDDRLSRGRRDIRPSLEEPERLREEYNRPPPLRPSEQPPRRNHGNHRDKGEGGQAPSTRGQGNSRFKRPSGGSQPSGPSPSLSSNHDNGNQQPNSSAGGQQRPSKVSQPAGSKPNRHNNHGQGNQPPSSSAEHHPPKPSQTPMSTVQQLGGNSGQDYRGNTETAENRDEENKKKWCCWDACIECCKQ